MTPHRARIGSGGPRAIRPARDRHTACRFASAGASPAVVRTGHRPTRARIGESKALSDWRDEEALPGPTVADAANIRDYLFKNLLAYFHYTGTCRIGTDDMAVVDPELRLRGISGLRVADASVMPSIPGGNTNATVFAIGERAAEILKNRY